MGGGRRTPESNADALGGAQGGPLVGLRVLELGNMIAAPYAGKLFAAFGTEVISSDTRQDKLKRKNCSSVFGISTYPLMSWIMQKRDT